MLKRHSLLLVMLLFLPTTVFAAVRYVVKKGDTLYGISKKFGVSLDELKEANRLKDKNLKVGSVVFIPGDSEATLAPPPNQGFEYVVIKGDTLFGVANGFRVSAEDIKKINNLKSNGIRIGQKLLIPVAKTDADSTGGGAVSRIIHENKTKGAGISPSELIARNQIQEKPVRENSEGLEPDVPFDRKLSKPIPPPPAADSIADSKPIHITRRYVAKVGDTLDTISKEFRVSPEVVKDANGLLGDKIDAGSILLIPNTDTASPEGNQAPPNVNISYNGTNFKNEKVIIKPKLNPNLGIKYVVRKGDTAFSIAKKFDVPLSDLKEINRIEEGVRAGDTLVIPYVEGRSPIAEKEPKFTDRLSRENIINIAKRYLGVPYKFGGTSLITGLDCSAFINKVFGFFDVKLPRTARELFVFGDDVKKEQIAVGDLVFFRTYARYPSHVGIYMGDNEFIHASSGAKKVTITNLDDPYYRKRYLGAKRIETSGLFYDEMTKDYKGFGAN